VLGDSGNCSCGAPYDSNRLPQTTVDEIHRRAASYQAKRKGFIVQVFVAAIAVLVVARSAPLPITAVTALAAWYWFGWRGYRSLRQTDNPTTTYPLK
jgi:hypothetical protein